MAKLRTWSPDIDPATIPDDVILAERAKRNSARRQTKSGGRNGGRPTLPRCSRCGKPKRADHACT